ncbi:MAG: hypothetical protein ACOY4R_21170 [Pseudomonadota bacterium]
MLIVLIAALAAGLVGHGIAHILRRRGLLPEPRAGAPVEGFGGWLLLLAGLQWLAVFGLLAWLSREMGALQRPGAAGTPALLTGYFAILAFVTWTAVAMMRRRRLFLVLLRIELVLLVVLSTMDLSIFGSSYVTEPKAWLAVLARFALASGIAALGFAYSAASVRVRNTFVR